MASFLSSPTQFTPYRDPYSLDLYAKVGMQKEAQYNAGLQKVQGAYDTVAGLKMGREIDAQYLNQKVQGLQTQYQKLVGSDYSKATIVNQAAGYAQQIYSDPRVQNAAISAQNAIDASNQIQEARKAGKSSESNDNLVLRNIAKWQNGDENATLAKQSYTPYYNYNKGWQDFMAKIHPNIIIEDTPRGAKSPYGVAYTLNQGRREYLTAGQLAHDFQTYLTTDQQAAQQVQTDGILYSDRTPDHIAIQNINNNYRGQVAQLDIAINKLEEDKAIYTSAEDVAAIEAKKQDYQSQRDSIQMNLNNGIYEKQFLKNPEQGKISMFISNLSQGIGDTYAYENIESKIVKNPEYDAAMDEDRLNIAKNDALLRQANFKLSQDKFALDQAQFQYKQTSEGRDSAGNLVPITTPVTAPPSPEKMIADNVQLGAEVRQDQLKTLFDSGNMDTLVKIGKDANGNTKYFLQDGRTEQDFVTSWTNLTRAYYKDPNSAKAATKAFFDNPEDPNKGIGRHNIYRSNNAAFVNKEKELEQQFQNDPEYRKYTNTLKRNSGASVIYSSNGISLTRDDLVKYANADNKKNSGLSPDKLALIETAISSKPMGGSIFELNQFQQNDPTSVIRQELVRANDFINHKNKYREARTAAYTDLATELYPTVGVSESTAGTNGKATQDKIGSLGTLLSSTGRDKEKESYDEVMASGGAKTLAINKTPDGKFYATLKGDKKESIPIEITPAQIGSFAPSLTRPNPNVVIETDLRNSRQGRGASSTTSNYYTPDKYSNNMNNYQLRAKYKDNGQGGVSVLLEYYQKGTNHFNPLPETPYFPTIDQAKAYFNSISAEGDNHFEATFLKP